MTAGSGLGASVGLGEDREREKKVASTRIACVEMSGANESRLTEYKGPMAEP